MKISLSVKRVSCAVAFVNIRLVIVAHDKLSLCGNGKWKSWINDGVQKSKTQDKIHKWALHIENDSHFMNINKSVNTIHR